MDIHISFICYRLDITYCDISQLLLITRVYLRRKALKVLSLYYTMRFWLTLGKNTLGILCWKNFKLLFSDVAMEFLENMFIITK